MLTSVIVFVFVVVAGLKSYYCKLSVFLKIRELLSSEDCGSDDQFVQIICFKCFNTLLCIESSLLLSFLGVGSPR